MDILRLSLVTSLFNTGFYLATSLIVLYFSDLGMPEFLIGVAMTLARLSYGLASMFSGAMADRVGRYYPMLTGFLLGASSTMLLSTIRTQSVAILLLIAAWVGYSMYSPAALALVSEVSRGTATSYGWYYLFITAGQIVGQALSGSAVKLGGYSLAFASGGTLGLISAVLTWLWFRGNRRSEAGVDLLRDLGEGARVLIRNRYLSYLAISLSLHGIGFTMTFTFIPLVARLDQGMSEPEIGLALSIWSFGNLIATVPLGRVTDRIGGRAMLIYHLLASSLVWWIYPFLRDLILIYALMLIQGFVGAMDLPARRLLLVGISEREVATAIGSLDSITFLLSSLGNLLAGCTWYLGHWVPFVMGCIVNTVGLAVLLRVKPR
ncbi:MAG: MFS transporter [Candidatus Korarchaeum sp.]